MPYLQFKPGIDSIKAEYPENKDLQWLQVPKELGGKMDMILGISFNRIYSEIIALYLVVCKR